MVNSPTVKSAVLLNKRIMAVSQKAKDIETFHLLQSEHVDVAYMVARTFRVLIVRRMLKMTPRIVPHLENPR